MWTWLEKLHDTSNGLMEADEYRMETVSLNRVAELELTCRCFPLKAWCLTAPTQDV